MSCGALVVLVRWNLEAHNRTSRKFPKSATRDDSKNDQVRSDERRNWRRPLPQVAAPHHGTHVEARHPQLGHARERLLLQVGWTSRSYGPNRTAQTHANGAHLRNIKSIREFASRNGGNQGHGRFLHVWRWESDIVEYGDSHNADRETQASNITDWFSLHLEEFRIQKARSDNMLVRGHKRCRRVYQ